MSYTECEMDTAVTIALHLGNLSVYDGDIDCFYGDDRLSKGEKDFLDLQSNGQCYFRSHIVHYAQVIEETFDNLTEREQNTLTEHTAWDLETVITIIERAGPDITKIEQTIQELIKEYAEQE